MKRNMDSHGTVADTTDHLNETPKQEVVNDTPEELNHCIYQEGSEPEVIAQDDKDLDSTECKEIKQKLEQKTKESNDYLELLQRTLAEFDNYKKRTAKEKETLYNNAIIDIITNILPIIDNMEKALDSCKGDEQKKIVDGVEMILRQLKDVLKTYNIHEIEVLGQKFAPELHEAVMHISDENYGENEIVEELRKGYKFGDKVVRHSMVKVAN